MIALRWTFTSAATTMRAAALSSWTWRATIERA